MPNQPSRKSLNSQESTARRSELSKLKKLKGSKLSNLWPGLRKTLPACIRVPRSRALLSNNALVVSEYTAAFSLPQIKCPGREIRSPSCISWHEALLDHRTRSAWTMNLFGAGPRYENG
jgi:hypothetical protein